MIEGSSFCELRDGWRREVDCVQQTGGLIAAPLGPFDPARHGLLRLNRARQFSDSLRRYQIEIDGQKRGAIGMGGIAEIPLEPGAHQLILKMDWFASHPLEFHIRAGERFTFHCWSNIRGWRLLVAGIFALYYLIRRHEYLSVQWVEAGPGVATA